MSPLTPKTITRLNPAVPLLWRDGTTVQAGTDGELRIIFNKRFGPQSRASRAQF